MQENKAQYGLVTWALFHSSIFLFELPANYKTHILTCHTGSPKYPPGAAQISLASEVQNSIVLFKN